MAVETISLRLGKAVHQVHVDLGDKLPQGYQDPEEMSTQIEKT